MFQTIFLPHQHGRSALDTSRTLFFLASTQGVSCRLVMNHLIYGICICSLSYPSPHIYVSKCMYVYVHISLFLPECACTTIIDISPRIFKLICCCVSIIIVICICPPGVLIWLINLFLFLFLFLYIYFAIFFNYYIIIVSTMPTFFFAMLVQKWHTPGADPGFQVREVHLKKLRRTEGGTKMFGVFRVKNHDFTQKNHIFFQF
jgi:hypothetical protein